MQLETPAFAAFLALALFAFWTSGSTRAQNVVLVAANYLFCAWLDLRFAVVLALVSAASFGGGFWIAAGTGRARRTRLVVSLVGLTFTLLVLKYGRVFLETIGHAVPAHENVAVSLGVMFFVPIGLSYYVLQTAGYCIDVYRGRAPERDAVAWFAYVGFFPSLVAGPIAQAGGVLTQFVKQRRFSSALAREGARQVVWGLFKKLVVADALARTVDYVFARHGELPASSLALGLVMYSFQIYADFSGYSDIAIGTARLFGFELPRNFDLPYFSRSVAEFWRRWHMSLSAWLRNYVYHPLGGRGTTRLSYARNILAVFALSGLWHGVSWNFLAWGVVNGLFFLPMIIFGRGARPGAGSRDPDAAWTIGDWAGLVSTFSLISLSRVFFRTSDLAGALGFYRALFDRSFFSVPDLNASALGWVALLLAIEWVMRFGMPSLLRRPVFALLRYPVYATVLYLVAAGFTRNETRQFLYAHF